MKKISFLLFSLIGLPLALGSCQKNCHRNDPLPTPPQVEPQDDPSFEPNIEGTELPLFDFEHSQTYDAIVKHEAKLGRVPRDFHDPEVPGIPLYGYYNEKLTFRCIEYDLQDLRFNSKRIDVFVNETPDHYPLTEAMLQKAGFGDPHEEAGHTIWKKGRYLIVLVPHEVPDLGTHLKLEIIRLKAPNDYTGRKLHATVIDALDLPPREIITADVDAIKAYEDKLAWRNYRDQGSEKNIHPLFVTIPDKVQTSNVAWMQYFRNFHDDTFIEAQLVTLQTIMDVTQDDFMQWLKNNGYEPTAHDGQFWTSAQEGSTMIMFTITKNDCMLSVRALPVKTGGFDFFMQIRHLSE